MHEQLRKKIAEVLAGILTDRYRGKVTVTIQ